MSREPQARRLHSPLGAVGMGVRRWAPGVAARLVAPMKVLSVVFFVGVVAAAFSANFGVFLVAIGTVALPVALGATVSGPR